MIARAKMKLVICCGPIRIGPKTRSRANGRSNALRSLPKKKRTMFSITIAMASDPMAFISAPPVQDGPAHHTQALPRRFTALTKATTIASDNREPEGDVHDPGEVCAGRSQRTDREIREPRHRENGAEAERRNCRRRSGGHTIDQGLKDRVEHHAIFSRVIFPPLTCS